MIGKIFELAKWSMCSERHEEVRTAVVVAFYEHVPRHPQARYNFRKWVSKREYVEIRDILVEGATTEEILQLDKLYAA